MKKTLVIMMLIISVYSFADIISQESAEIVAKNWYNEKQGITDAEISNVIIEEIDSIKLFYVFNFVEGGYAIVTAEDNAPPILGYGAEDTYQLENHPPQFDWLLENYKQQIITIINEKLLGREESLNEWNRLSVPIEEFQPEPIYRDVAPLLTSEWNQNSTWNQDCPVDTQGPGGHAYAGCGAVATAQIMNFWEHPSEGNGSNSYSDPLNYDEYGNPIPGSAYGTISANFESTTYNWANMNDTTPTNDSRELLFHCGVATNMNYGPYGSTSYSSDTGDAMEDYFYYNTNSSFKSKSSYNASVWNAMIIEQLDSGYPVWYRGSTTSTTGGHAFILDGYEGTDYFHFNWGWGGQFDEYFYLNDLTPYTFNFNSTQKAYFNLIPAAKVSGHVDLVAGSGNVDYVDVECENLSTGDIYSFSPDANGDFGNKNLRSGSYRITYSLSGYHDYVVNSYSINVALLNIELPDAILFPLMNGGIIVNQDGPGDFTNISYAVQAVDQSAIIYVVGPEIYSGENNKNISWNGNEKDITIWGSGNAVIDCENDGRAFTINNGTEEDIIKGLTIINTNTNYDHGGAIKIVNGCPKLINNTFENCSSGDYPQYATQANGGAIYIEDCDGALIQGNMFDSNSAFSGGAMYIVNSSFSLTYNTFLSNASGHILDGTDGSTGIAGAVHIVNCFDTNISNNLFEANFSNHASAAMAIVNASDNTVVELNTFNENEFGQLDTLGEYESAILGLYNGIVECRDNLFTGNTSQYGLEAILDASGCNGNITNNSFINNTGYIWKVISFGYYVSDEEIKNCLFLNNAASYISIGDVTLTNCNTYQSGDLGTGVIEGEGCLIGIDPLLNSTTYQPLWNSSVKSPCIDSGDQSISDDDDGSPADIGAICAVTHRYDEVDLPSPLVNSGWKWLSFPSLDNVLTDADTAGYVLEDILDYSILEEVLTMNYTIGWDGSYWNHTDEHFSRTEGFKFHMNDDVTLDVPGFKVADNTTIALAGNEDANWVGYWIEETQLVSDAFASYWNGGNIIFIQHQFWSASRKYGVWYYKMQNEVQPTLSYGDMVIVKCNTAINDFKWDYSSPPVERTVFADPEYFTFEERAEYVPLFIEVDGNNMPREIGAYVNGVCIGATVVEDTLTQINAYTASAPPGNIELELYYGGRSENKRLSFYNCVRSSNPNIVLRQLSTENSDNAWFVDLREGSSIVPTPEKVSLNNYPNPFNPTTTIAYSLPNDGLIELRIFNVKGQLVKTLIDGEQLAGSYEMVWNGRDNNKKSVSSGIYFYKLSTKDKTIMKKMLMLK